VRSTRSTHGTAARLAPAGAALVLVLGGLAACGDDEPEPAPAPGVEDGQGTDPGEDTAPAPDADEGDDVEQGTDPGVGGPTDPEEPEG
jgi:hypothetical protein